MYVLPGRSLSIPLQFEIAADVPVVPTAAAYTVRDQSGVVQVSTPIPDVSAPYLVVPASINTLADGQKYRPMRIEIIFNVDNGVFEEDIVYYVVPDLFLGFDNAVIKSVLGVTDAELPSQPDYYRAYIDLATGPIATPFYNALMGNDVTNAATARNLILYAAVQNLLPALQFTVWKSNQSETSAMTRFAFDYTGLQSRIEAKYAYYYLQIQMLATPTNSPTFIVTDSPTDAITGQ